MLTVLFFRKTLVEGMIILLQVLVDSVCYIISSYIRNNWQLCFFSQLNVRNYWEAIGVIAAHKAGVNPNALRRQGIDHKELSLLTRQVSIQTLLEDKELI